ncbi:hypothetical protein ACWDUL_33815 [Nocardia niigatensis]
MGISGDGREVSRGWDQAKKVNCLKCSVAVDLGGILLAALTPADTQVPRYRPGPVAPAP